MTVQRIVKVIFLNIFVFIGQVQCGKSLGSLFSDSMSATSTRCDVAAIHVCVAECIGLKSANYRNQATSKLSTTCTFNSTSGQVLPYCDISKMIPDKNSKYKVICGVNICTEGQMCLPIIALTYGYLVDNCSHILLDNFIEIKSNRTHKHTLSVDPKKRKLHNVDVLLQTRGDSKVLASVTGSARSFSMIAASEELRANFVNQAREIMQSLDLDGIELQWRFPHCWQGNCSAGLEEDSTNFVTLLSELSKEFKPRNWLITSILPNDYKLLESAFDLEDTIKYLDWMIVETHNYHLESRKCLAFHAPLNLIKATMQELKEANIDHSKLIIRITPILVSYDLPVDKNRAKKKDSDRIVPSAKPGAPANLVLDPLAAQPFVIYCQYAQTMNVVHANETVPGTYMYSVKVEGFAEQHLNRWFSVEDMYTIGVKTAYVKKFGFGGAMLEYSEFDDIQNNCQCGGSPLLRAINNGLRGEGCEIPSCILSKSEATEKFEKMLQAGESIATPAPRPG